MGTFSRNTYFLGGSESSSDNSRETTPEAESESEDQDDVDEDEDDDERIATVAEDDIGISAGVLETHPGRQIVPRKREDLLISYSKFFPEYIIPDVS